MKIFPIKNIQLQNTKNIYCSEINTNKNNIENRSLSSNSNISSDVYKSNFLPFKSLKMRGISLNNDFCDTSFYRDADTLRQSVDVIKENFPEGTDIMDFACSNGEETISIYSLLEHNPQYKIHGYDRCPKAIDLANAGIYSVMTKGICDSFLTGENCNDENYDLKNKFYKIMDVVENPDFKNDESLKLVRLMNSFPEIKLKFFKLKDEHKKELSYNLGDINDIKNLGPQKVGAIYFRNAFYIPTKNYDFSLARANNVLQRMEELGWITKEQLQEGVAETPKVYDETLTQNVSPYVVDEVQRQLKNIEDLKRLLRGKTTAIAGPSGVGKSSLTNALLGTERNIVTPIAGTTRDSILSRYNKFGMDFYLIDTAGLRKKTKVTEDLEFYSVLRSVRSIETSDVCILMIDATTGIESQDLNIFNLIVRNKKGCVIVINKWDLVDKTEKTMKEMTENIRRRIAPFSDVPIIFTSVLNKQRIMDVLQTAMRVYHSRARRIPTSELNEYLLPIIEETPPPSTKGKYIRIKYVTQLSSPTPVFAFFVNLPQYIKEGYRRYLENKIREHWDFQGVPIQIFFRQK